MKKLALVGLLVVALLVSACGGSASIYGNGNFTINGDLLVAEKDAVVCFTEPVVLEQDDIKITLAAGQGITATTALTVTFDTGDVVGSFTWGNCPLDAPMGPAEEEDADTGTPTPVTGPDEPLLIYVTEKAKDSNDWRTIEPTIGPDATVVLVSSVDEVPPWDGTKQVWFGRWSKDPTYLLYQETITYAEFQALGASDDFVVWHE